MLPPLFLTQDKLRSAFSPCMIIKTGGLNLALLLTPLLAILFAIPLHAGTPSTPSSESASTVSDYDALLHSQISALESQGKKWSRRRAYPYLHKAYRLLADGHPAAAVDELESYLRKVPDDPNALWQLANLLAEQKQYAAATQAYQRLSAILPQFSPAQLKAAISQKMLGQSTAADRLFRQALETGHLTPGDQDYALRELVALALKDKRYAGAMHYLQTLLKAQPEDPSLLHQAAIIETKLKHPDKAAAWLEHLLAVDANTEKTAEILESLVYLYGQSSRSDVVARLDTLRQRHRSAFHRCPLALQAAYRYVAKQAYQNAFDVLAQADAGQRQCGDRYPSYLETFLSSALHLDEQGIANRILDQLVQLANNDSDRSRWLTMKGNLSFAHQQLPAALTAYREAAAAEPNKALREKASEVAWQLKDYAQVTELAAQSPQSLQDPDQLARLCVALRAQHKPRKALDCYLQMSRLTPKQVDPHLVAAELAHQLDQPAQEIKSLQAAYALAPDPTLGVNIGYRLKAIDPQAAHDWFARLDTQPGQRVAPLAQLELLYAEKDATTIVTLATELLQHPEQLTREQRIAINRKLALAHDQHKAYKREANAWIRAYRLSGAFNDLLNIVTTFYAAEDYAKAAKVLQQIDPARVPADKRAYFQSLAGATYTKLQDYPRAEAAQRDLVAIEPTAQNWFDLAMTELKLNKTAAAEHAIDAALELDPNNQTYRLNKAYIAGNNEHYDVALNILTALPEQDFDSKLNEDTAYLGLKAGNQKLAAQYFRKALDNSAKSSAKDRPQADMKLLAIRDTLRQLESGYRVQFAQVGCFGASACQPSAALQESESGYGFGNLRLFYSLTPRLTASTGLIWNNKNDSIEPLGKSSSGAIGLVYSPLPKTNLKLSVDRLIKLGDLGQDNTLLRAAWSTVPGGKDAQYRGIYQHVYAEASALLENNKEKQLFLEGRTGIFLPNKTVSLLTPYLYGQLRGQSAETQDYVAAEAGFGISATVNHMQDKYKGARAQSTLFAKTGAELYNSATDEDLRALVGYEFSYH